MSPTEAGTGEGGSTRSKVLAMASQNADSVERTVRPRESMGREHDQLGIVHVHERHHDEVVCGLGGCGVPERRVGRMSLVAVCERGRISVMTIGDKDGALADDPGYSVYRTGVADRPDLAQHPFGISGGEHRFCCDVRVEDAVGLASGVGEQAEDLAQVRGGGAREVEAVGKRLGQRALVGEDHAVGEGVQADGGDEPTPTDVAAFVLPGLLNDVDRGRIVVHEDALLVPRLPQRPARLVTVARQARVERALR